MRRVSITTLICLIVPLILAACDSIPLYNPSLATTSQSHLVETVLPQKYKSSVRKTMRFSPDGSRIVVYSLSGIEVLNVDPPKLLTAFETRYSQLRWAKYLDTNAIAFDNDDSGEVLLPDLTRQPLPKGTISVRNDGRFAITSGNKDAASNGVIEIATGRQVCALEVNRRPSSGMNESHAVFGNRGSAVSLCELATGKRTLLVDPDSAVMSEGVLDPQGKFLLVIAMRSSFFGDMHSNTNVNLYRLPLVPNRVLPGYRDVDKAIEVKPVKTWDWHTYVRAEFSPDGKWLAIASHKKLEIIRTDALDERIELHGEISPHAIHFSRDSQWLAAQDKKSIYLAKLQGVPQFTRLAVPDNPEEFDVTDIAPDGSALLGSISRTSDAPSKHVLWRIQSGPK